jgi:hypothetical protein
MGDWVDAVGNTLINTLPRPGEMGPVKAVMQLGAFTLTFVQ